jgi:hypothetical protein
MGDSRRLQILDAVATRLAVATVTVNSVVRTKPTGLAVHRFRLRPIAGESLPAQVVYMQSDPDPERRATGVLDRVMRLAVEHLVKVTAGTPPDDTVDPLISWAVLALMSDETMGGLASQITERGTVWAPEEGEQSFMRAMTVFDIQYLTKDTDPEAAP